MGFRPNKPRPGTQNGNNCMSKHRLQFYKQEQRSKKKFEAKYMVGKSFDIKGFKSYDNVRRPAQNTFYVPKQMER